MGWGEEEGQEEWRDLSHFLEVLFTSRQKMIPRFTFAQGGKNADDFKVKQTQPSGIDRCEHRAEEEPGRREKEIAQEMVD